jgi:hypothetical protein
MGGAQSLFSENDWDAADGHIETADQTIDGAAPTQIYQTYHLIKKAVLANQREFDVTDSASNLLFHVRPSFGTIAGFDVLGIGSAATDDYILRVTVDIARRHWIVYRFGKPVFEGQKPDETATLKFAAEQQTNRKELAARISASLAIHSFNASDDDRLDPAIVALPPPSPKHFLYKVCCITVSWSRYMAVAAYYGPPTVEQLLTSKKHEKAVQEMANDDGNDHDLLLQASRIAERMRDRPSLADDLMDDESEADKTHSTAVSQDQSDNVMTKSETDVSSDEVPSKENEAHSQPTSGEQSEAVSAPPNSNNTPSVVAETAELDKHEPSDTSSAEESTNIEAETSLSSDVDTEPAVNLTVLNPTTKAQSEPGAPSNSEDTNAAMPTMPCDIADSVESADHRDDTTNVDATDPAETKDHAEEKASGSDSNSPATVEQDYASVGNDDSDEAENDDAVPEVKASKSMPELASDAFNTDKLRTWFKETSRTIHSKSKLILRQTNSYDDMDKSGTGNYAAFLGMGPKPAEDDDPLEGVIHLEKPLLLCQEIYTRIIGNHQTSRVSKKKVLSLLKQDMEHHVEREAIDKLDKSDSAHDNTASSTGTENGKIVETLVTNLESKPTNGSLETCAPDASGPLDASERSEKKDQPLVGYWAWEHSLRTHKIKMHLAKGSDLALHVVLAVLVNQVRYERNAIAIAV